MWALKHSVVAVVVAATLLRSGEAFHAPPFAALPSSAAAQSAMSSRAGRATGVAVRMQVEEAQGGRREALRLASAALTTTLFSSAAGADSCTRADCQPAKMFVDAEEAERKKDTVSMPGLNPKLQGKTVSRYPDYVSTESGLQYKDAKQGKGESPGDGDRVVIDWEGYTIGYYGRIFQKKNSVVGGAFADDPGYYRFVLGTGSLLPGLEEGIKGMKPGGVRQIVVPPGPLNYPIDDSGHKRVGPRPSTFDGMRALNFVMENKGLIDKTLLFNVKLIRVDKKNDKGEYTRGDTV
uniref:peptidylprolyl isomerase n=1 Tax=Hemiselmis tepida TaxID=464990 RepID=A0A7S0VSM8_9CRYP|mmetsp:Transcript_26541/g.67440  ORF Transcript_26541/g.67440 Transcript_26541/m.67440 type:complete len:293 (+) Transcript_26541:61-939(+)|eukprot:CAMPEP_0174931556 /NCGR_PEP_ID=MMETSP1355-20121228/34113_1 /TAXON_ID=464990 /ORGANISM="Hemiselmis tepida, Strain CCMP443" /LENGTH=292 /DNA_ID=CAMNT_0016177919 /DNA_START=46 /DNA_END=924 /DNA_ORIENTATION=+